MNMCEREREKSGRDGDDVVKAATVAVAVVVISSGSLCSCYLAVV